MSDIKAVSLLRKLGLSPYESESFVALMKLGPSTVADLYKVTKIPHANLYSVMEKLAERGFVIISPGRPKIFKALPPEEVKNEFNRTVNELVEILKKLEQESKTTEAWEILYTIRGHDNVISKIESMLSSCEESVMIVAPSIDLFPRNILERLKKLSGKISDFRIITSTGNATIEGAQHRISDKISAIDIVTDDHQSLISLSDFSVCGWIENPIITMHFKQFLEQTWSNSKER